MRCCLSTCSAPATVTLFGDYPPVAKADDGFGFCAPHAEEYEALGFRRGRRGAEPEGAEPPRQESLLP